MTSVQLNVLADLERVQQLQPERGSVAEISRQCVACLLLLCQGYKWLKWYERLTSIQNDLSSNPSWIADFFFFYTYSLLAFSAKPRY